MRTIQVVVAGMILTIGLLVSACGGQLSVVDKQAARSDVRVTATTAKTPAVAPESRIIGEPQTIPHEIEIRFECLLCHGEAGDTEVPYPDTHIGVTEDRCLVCHVLAEALVSAPEGGTESTVTPGSGPPAAPHSFEGREDCVTCHGENGFLPFPSDHAGWSDSQCGSCHQPR